MVEGELQDKQQDLTNDLNNFTNQLIKKINDWKHEIQK